MRDFLEKRCADGSTTRFDERMSASAKVHLYRIAAISGGILAYWVIGHVAADRFGDLPLFAISIATVSPVVLFGWLVKTGQAFQGRVETTIPFVVLALSPFLLLTLNWWSNPFDSNALRLDDGRQILNLITFCLLVGLGEELLFRGYVFSLCNQWNTPIALLVSSMVFGLLHFDRGWYGTLFAVAGGFGLGLGRIAGIPLWILVIVHAGTNLPTSLSQSEPHYYVQHFAILVITYTALVAIAFLATPRHWSNNNRGCIAAV